MLLTISTTIPEATDLGSLLHENPRAQPFTVSSLGTAQLPAEATAGRARSALSTVTATDAKAETSGASPRPNSTTDDQRGVKGQGSSGVDTSPTGARGGWVKRVGLVGAVAVVGVASTACGSTSTTIAPSTSTSALPTSTVTVTSTASAPLSTTTASGTSRPADCTNDEVATTTGTLDGGASHAGYVLVFRNISTRPCTLTGYPGVEALAR